MASTYDEDIKRHYDGVASDFGLEPSSTMTDLRIREVETTSILKMVSEYMARENIAEADLRILDVGCGNGYMLSKLRERFPLASLHGIEPNESLRNLALVREICDVSDGDLRSQESLAQERIHVTISQRVLINILDPADQRRAIRNLTNSLSPGSLIIFVECFTSGLDSLNVARAEFNLDPIPTAPHNLYLNEADLEAPELIPVDLGVSRHSLSSHYYVARVIHDVLLRASGARPFKNSAFVGFLSNVMSKPTGEFSPIQFLTFVKE